jgi:inhibitor of KinA
MLPRLFPLADAALCIDWGNQIDPELNDRVLALCNHLKAARLPGILNLAPAYSSLTVVYDAALLPYERLCAEVGTRQSLAPASLAPADRAPAIEIPVCYDHEMAPDLEPLARRSGLDPEAVIQLHLDREYRVYMLGFLPGFPYMGTVDPAIAAPRHTRPRVKVPAGSVGIAGVQTGIYPLESPGGWNLIGRTPLHLFDPAAAVPALLKAGDRVRFRRISLEQFQEITD